MKASILISSILFSFTLLGCGPQAEQNEIIRSVKTIKITKVSETNTRTFAGVVKTADESELSFRVSGRVKRVAVKQGARIKKGQVLAALDQKDYKLAVRSAKAKLKGHQAETAEKKENARRQKNLAVKNFVSQAAVEKAEAAYQTALSNVNIAQTDLQNAEDDLERTILRAPFSGRIGARHIEPFTQVQAGTKVFDLQGGQGFKVEVLIPETLIRDINYGDPVEVTFPTFKGVRVNGVISEIGAQAKSGNAYPVKANLAKTKRDLRAGMTAELSVRTRRDAKVPVYLIPITAVDLRFVDTNIAGAQTPVFVYDEKTSTLSLRRVSVIDVRENDFEVIDGLKEGDIIVTAGVSFLSEGQKVKLWKPQYTLPVNLDR